MRPVVSIAEMRAADAAALKTVDEEVLVERAGTAVAVSALQMLGGAYGRRVVVIAGPGNNGADGRVAAAVLRRRGARVQVVPAEQDDQLPAADLVIDAAYGTGFRGRYDGPRIDPDVPVLAVDIPSGVFGDTGQASGSPLRARRTVTFAALKPGLLLGAGAELAGEIEVVDIGVPVTDWVAALVEDLDVARLPGRSRWSHKWQTAVAVVAGSPGMEGASALAARGASHAGAGMVRLAVPGSLDPAGGTRPGPWPLEVVRVPLPATGWAPDVLEAIERCAALVVGPGLGRQEATRGEIRRLIAHCPVPVIADADALAALGDAAEAREVITESPRPVVLTPHDGEFRAMAGRQAGEDRLAAARDLARRTRAVVLLKGPLTVVAEPPVSPADATEGPPLLLSMSGSARLATAGTGDVLSGVIGAFVARGLPPSLAAALGAHVHGRAASLGPAEGLVASDLPMLVSRWLSAEVLGG